MSVATPSLPPIARLIVRLTFPPAERAEVAADLASEVAARTGKQGPVRTQLWLWGQLIRSTPALLGRGAWRGWTGFESSADEMRPGGAPLESIVLDIRFAIRRLWSRPLYATLAVLTLALGIGGGAAIYSIARAFLIEPLPFRNERTLAVFWHGGDWTEEELVYLRGRAPGFSGIAGYRPSDATLREGDEPARLIHGGATTVELFDVLGTRPLLGRGFATGEDAQHAPPVAMLSYDLWQQLGGDQSVLGRRLILDGTATTVIGVMPRGFWFPDPTTQMWRPAPLNPENRVGNYGIVGRLADGTTPASLAHSLTGLSRIITDRFVGASWPGWLEEPPQVTPIRESFFGPLRPALIATLVAMGFLLLIACANVAALTLGQVDGRTTELAVRSALGADRSRITQQILIESLVVGIWRRSSEQRSRR